MDSKIWDQYKKRLDKDQDIYLKVKVIPNFPKTQLKEIMADQTLKISVKASPQKNKANQELIGFLAKSLGLSKDKIHIVSGLTQRLKLIHVYKS